MAASEVWGEFTPDEQAVLKEALHKKAKDMLVDEWHLAKRYWARMKHRSKYRGDKPDARVRVAYREWLEANNLPATPFDHRRYAAWKRGADVWTQ